MEIDSRFVFECLCEITRVGETVCVVGSTQELGCWDPSASIELTTSKDRFPLWYSSPICIGRLPAEFKFVIRRTTGEVKWENCDNRVLRRSRQCGNVLIRCRFGFRDISLSTESVFATETELSEDVSVDNHDEPHVPVRWGHVDGQMVGQRDYLEQLSIAATFVDEAGSKPSYRERLQLVSDTLAAHPDRESVALCVVLMKLINQKYVACSEDGRHYRPNHHATAALRITRALFNALDSSVAATVFLREMLPNLPSFEQGFTVAQPLTRIRDIAHRNDMSREMKNRIKHDLQNKLHRCCDPGDLDTCRQILEEMHHGRYNSSLVKEMETFYTELKAFFNASDLEVLLDGQPSISSHLRTRLLANHEHTVSSIVASLTAVHEARAVLQPIIHAPARELEERTRCLFVDLRLEQRAFALLSELEQLVTSVTDVLLAARIAVAQLRQTFPSDIELECVADTESLVGENLESLHDWRLLHAFNQRFLRWQSEMADIFLVLNDANLSLQQLVTHNKESAMHFGEGIVRSHLVFQATKFSSRLHKLTCEKLRLSAVEVVAGGKLNGCLLVHVNKIPHSRLVTPVTAKYPAVDVVLLVDEVSGDEQVVGVDLEIAALIDAQDVHVRGLIVRQAVPSLSHLGVRARQEDVVMLTVEKAEKETTGRLLSLVGSFIAVDTSQVSASAMVTASAYALPTQPTRPVTASAPRTPIAVQAPWSVQVGKGITLEACGHKAFRCGQLEVLASEAEFSAPRSAALPFSTLRLLLETDMEAKQEFARLIEALKSCRDSIRKATIASRLQEIVSELSFPENMATAIAEAADDLVDNDDDLLMVRSSANVEDSLSTSSAGLFASYPCKKSHLQARILDVLASLFSSTAVFSLASIDKVHMAILIQPVVHDICLSFVAHSTAPGVAPTEIYAEVARGHGEALASGAVKGTPHRLVIPRDGQPATVKTYSTLLHVAQVAPDSGCLEWSAASLRDDAFACSTELQVKAAEGIRNATLLLEDRFTGPQDIEGTISASGHIVVTQSRPIV